MLRIQKLVEPKIIGIRHAFAQAHLDTVTGRIAGNCNHPGIFD
jgi:hypothetical protein